MEQDINKENKCEGCGNCSTKKCRKMHGGGTPGCVYGLGVIGAAMYYIQLAPTFWAGVIGFLKALVWPAYLVYEAFKYLGM